jgi:hypothetical protein
VAIFENKSAKFDREITYFRVKKPKTQVVTVYQAVLQLAAQK